jgi:Skp family chaperone for outer membrane proteins
MTKYRPTLIASLATATAMVVCLGVARPSRAADGTHKIATANAAKIFNEMQETRDLKAKMENERKTLDATNKKKNEDLQQLKEGRDQLKPDAPQFQEQNQAYLKAQPFSNRCSGLR